MPRPPDIGDSLIGLPAHAGDTHGVNADRRRESRFPTWLPGTLWNPCEERGTPVRVVDLSFGGAAVEGPFRAPAAGPLKLQIEWSGIRLTLDCAAVRWSLDELPPSVAVRFGEITRTELLLLRALVDAISGGSDVPIEERSRGRRLLRLLSGEPARGMPSAPTAP